MCALYCYRKKARKSDPHWKLSLPRSRAGSRTTLRHLTSDGSETDGDTLKKSRSYDKVYRTHEPLEGKPNAEFPEKKWDLDEEDITSSEGSEFPHGKLAKDIKYIPTRNIDAQPEDTNRQTGRRNQQRTQITAQAPPLQQDDSNYLPPPVESPSSYSPTYSGGFGTRDNNFPEERGVQQRQLEQQRPGNRPPSGAIRVLPASNNQFFSEGIASPVSEGSPTLTQNVGLPTSHNNRSTEV